MQPTVSVTIGTRAGDGASQFVIVDPWGDEQPVISDGFYLAEYIIKMVARIEAGRKALAGCDCGEYREQKG